MQNAIQKNTSSLMVIIAFAIVYLVWGSTYFFIQRAIQHIPALFMGFMRFTFAGILLLLWCVIKKEDIWNRNQIKHAAVSGILMLFVGNGAVIWAEQSLPSSLVAVLVSAAPLWFILLDKSNWKINFTNRETITGIVIGFIGVIMLFIESTLTAFSKLDLFQLIALPLLIIGSMCWSGGSLYSKYKSTGSTTVNTAWQMFAAGVCFLPGAFFSNEFKNFHWQSVTTDSWISLIYLIIFGSLGAYSAYVWLLQVRPATQVSTYAYVNPVVAVLLGVFIADEKISLIQIAGLIIILFSVLLVNIRKYRKQHRQTQNEPAEETQAA